MTKLYTRDQIIDFIRDNPKARIGEVHAAFPGIRSEDDIVNDYIKDALDSIDKAAVAMPDRPEITLTPGQLGVAEKLNGGIVQGYVDVDGELVGIDSDGARCGYVIASELRSWSPVLASEPPSLPLETWDTLADVPTGTVVYDPNNTHGNKIYKDHTGCYYETSSLTLKAGWIKSPYRSGKSKGPWVAYLSQNCVIDYEMLANPTWNDFDDIPVEVAVYFGDRPDSVNKFYKFPSGTVIEAASPECKGSWILSSSNYHGPEGRWHTYIGVVRPNYELDRKCND